MYTPHLLQETAYREILERLEKLTASSQALWGKMSAAQMLAHLTKSLEMATSHEKRTQIFLGRIFGSSVKRQIFTKGTSRNTPTIPNLKMTEQKDFQKEKENVQHVLEKFVKGGEVGITTQPHDFFGRMTPNEWARLQYLHVDHHFKQFGA